MNSEWPPDWTIFELQDCGKWLSGGTPSTSNPDYWNGEIPWISGKSLRNHRIRNSDRRLTGLGVKHGTRVAPEGSTLFVVRGMSLKSEFRCGIAARDVAFGQDCKAIVPRDEIEPEFLAHAVRARSEEILSFVESSSHGTGRLPTDLIRALKVGVPSRDEQRAIAEAVNALDERIEWCIEQARQIEHLVVEMCRRPSGETVSVSDLGDFVNGGAFTKHETGAGRLIVRISELSSGISESSKYSTVDASETQTAFPGDILFSWSASLDVYRWCRDEAIVNQHIFKVIPKATVPSWLAYAKLKEVMPAFQKIARDRATTMGHIKRGHLDEVTVALPSSSALQQMAESLDALWESHLQLHLESRGLEALRDALLPKLASGELRIADPQVLLEPVA